VLARAWALRRAQTPAPPGWCAPAPASAPRRYQPEGGNLRVETLTHK
jgi:hypothetical protein